MVRNRVFTKRKVMLGRCVQDGLWYDCRMDTVSVIQEAKMPADLEFRRKLFMGYGIALALLIVLPWQLGPLLWQGFIHSGPRNILFIAETVSVIFLLGFIWPSLYLMAVGRLVLSEGRYPHSRMKVIFNTTIHRGKRAESMGRRLRLLGKVCIIAVVLGAGATHFIFYKFKNDPAFFLKK